MSRTSGRQKTSTRAQVMYNNEVTYNKDWNSPENLAAHARLYSHFFDRTWCGSDCPSAWSQEVLALLEDIDAKFGIRYNEGTMGGYTIQHNMFRWFVTGPW